MLSGRHRLRKRHDFLACYENGRRYYSRHFVLFVLSHSLEPEAWRLGLAVSKKMGNSVVRNRIKRVLRNFFHLHQCMLLDNMDFVVVPKRHLDVSYVNLDFVTHELKPILVNCCEKDF